MHKSWRFIPGLKALTVVLAASAVLVLGVATAFAQDEAGDAPGAVKKYVLMKSTGWGADQSAAVARFGGTVDFSHAGSGIGIVSSADPDFLKAAMRTGLFDRGGLDMMVQWQDPNMRVADESFDIIEEVVTPGNETFVNEQWNIVAIDAAGAWATGLTGAGARVAVLDGGIHSAHVDLDGVIDFARSTSFVPGFNFNQDTGTFWHGTHVAGIVAAEDNGIGTVGVAPGATIIGVKVLHNGSGAFSQVIAGILYASDPISAGGAGAHIINMSLGATFAKGGGNTGAGPLVASMNQAVNYATANGVLVVTSAGNSAIDMDHAGPITNVPAQSGTALAISATGPTGYGIGWPAGNQAFGTPAWYTNWGNSLVFLAAPGGNTAIFGTPPGMANCTIPRCCGGPAVTVPCYVHDAVMSTTRGAGASTTTYGWAEGTSMAAPAVSGVAALVVERFPGISVGELKNHLKNTADAVGGSDPLKPFYGHGFVNAGRAATEGGPVSQAVTKSPKLETPVTTRVELVIGRNAGGSVPEISFALPSAGSARVDLYDVAGRRVAELFNGTAASGRTTLSWSGRGSNGEALGRGVYFARLTANGVTTSRTLLLLGQ